MLRQGRLLPPKLDPHPQCPSVDLAPWARPSTACRAPHTHKRSSLPQRSKPFLGLVKRRPTPQNSLPSVFMTSLVAQRPLLAPSRSRTQGCRQLSHGVRLRLRLKEDFRWRLRLTRHTSSSKMSPFKTPSHYCKLDGPNSTKG